MVSKIVKKEVKSEEVAVVVTTAHRGVFFGFADRGSIESKSSIWLKRARNCIFWHRSIGGLLGLASVGPNKECRIGAQAAEILLHDITSVFVCSEEAVNSWTSQ